MNLDFRSEQAVQGALAYERACSVAGQGVKVGPAVRVTAIEPSVSTPACEPVRAA